MAIQSMRAKIVFGKGLVLLPTQTHLNILQRCQELVGDIGALKVSEPLNAACDATLGGLEALLSMLETDDAQADDEEGDAETNGEQAAAPAAPKATPKNRVPIAGQKDMGLELVDKQEVAGDDEPAPEEPEAEAHADEDDGLQDIDEEDIPVDEYEPDDEDAPAEEPEPEPAPAPKPQPKQQPAAAAAPTAIDKNAGAARLAALRAKAFEGKRK